MFTGGDHKASGAWESATRRKEDNWSHWSGLVRASWAQQRGYGGEWSKESVKSED